LQNATKDLLLSVVIPAFNESAYLSPTIASVRASFSRAGIGPYQIIVVDDASTDGTADVARRARAFVVASGCRNIGATRNAGAKVARGKYLLFLDADTHLNAGVAEELAAAVARGAMAGGTCFQWSEKAPWHGVVAAGIWNCISRIFRWPCGSFIFVQRDVFEKVGGFDEAYFASEEIHLARKLKKHGRLVILHAKVSSSPRKLDQISVSEVVSFVLRWLRAPRRTLQTRRYLDYWYNQRG